MSAPLRFCFDFLSPYAYLAWRRIHAIGEHHGRAVEPWPVVFAGLLEAHGTKGPAEIPAKRRYLIRDIVRIARALEVPIAPPFALPFRSLHALRLASLPLDPATRRALIDRLYAASWARGEDVTDRRVLESIAIEVGLGASAVEDAESAENKARLRAQTDAAIAAGAFGVPTVIADGEIFWGTDALPHLERFLRGEDPIAASSIEAFDRVPVGARRS